MSDRLPRPALRLVPPDAARDRRLLADAAELAAAHEHADLLRWCHAHGIPADPPVLRYALALAVAQDMLAALAARLRDTA